MMRKVKLMERSRVVSCNDCDEKEEEKHANMERKDVQPPGVAVTLMPLGVVMTVTTFLTRRLLW